MAPLDPALSGHRLRGGNDRPPHDQRVDDAGAGAARHYDQWIDIDFGDLVCEIVREPRQPHDQIAQAFDIARRHAAHALEQFVSPQFAQHRARLCGRDRRNAIAYVAQDLDVDAAQTNRNDGTEYGVPDDAEHQFDALRHHFLNQYAIDMRA